MYHRAVWRRRLLVLAWIGCGTSCTYSEAKRSECSDTSSDAYYFPPGSSGFPAGSDLDIFDRKRFSQALRTMSEPSLSCQEPSGESYRFLIASERSVAVRVTEDHGAGHLVGVEITEAPVNVKQRVQKSLTRAQWIEVKEAVTALDFWRMPSEEKDCCGADGETWIIEGRRGSKYHVVRRWSPRNGAIQRWLSLMKWAGLMKWVEFR